MTYFQPLLPAILLILLVTVIRLVTVSRPAKRIWRSGAIAAAVALLLIPSPPVAFFFLYPLQSGYSDRAPTDRSASAIVVLSSAVFPPTPPRPTAILGTDTYE